MSHSHTRFAHAWFVHAHFAHTRLAVLVVAALVSVAVSASTVTGQVTSAAGRIAVAPDSASTVPALSESENAMLRRMTDANILERLSTTDSLAVAMSQVARSRSADTAVASFAGQLIADHSMSLQRDRLIAQRPHLGVQLMPGDTSALVQFRALDSLTHSTSAANFDRRYLAAQIQMQGHWLAVLQTLQHVAHDRALNQHVVAAIPIVTRHLARAKQLASNTHAAAGG